MSEETSPTKEERLEQILDGSAWELANWVVELEDEREEDQLKIAALRKQVAALEQRVSIDEYWSDKMWRESNGQDYS